MARCGRFFQPNHKKVILTHENYESRRYKKLNKIDKAEELSKEFKNMRKNLKKKNPFAIKVLN